MQHRQRTVARTPLFLASLALALGTAASPLLAAPSSGARSAMHRVGKLEVWVDDARTRRIEVEKLDPREIADSSSLSLKAGFRIGGIGIGLGWSREKGIAYDERARALIASIAELCREFNEGELTLETYQRRLRRISNAVEEARLCRLELLAATSIDANDAGRRLDEALGLPVDRSEAHKRATEEAIAEFRELVRGIDPGTPASGLQGSRATQAPERVDSEPARAAVERSLAAIDAALDPRVRRQLEAAPKITIWADRARTTRIVVPRLDVEHLVNDFEDSLGLRLRCSPPLFTFTVGSDVVRTLHQKAEYDQAATLLIVKYRTLCLEYNSGILPQEAYSERLVELQAAERRAFDARTHFLDQLDEAVDAARGRLRELLDEEDPALVGDLEQRKREMRGSVRERLAGEPQGSLVDELSREHREQMAAWESFPAAVDALAVELPSSSIEVWVDAARTRKVRVPQLDTDILAQSVETRLTLHITYFRFGPEAEWARKRGLEYGEAAQELIVKSKQLCMDYNAGLVPQESFDQRRAAIEASLERAARVQQRVIEFTRELKGSARAELDRRLEQRRAEGER